MKRALPRFVHLLITLGLALLASGAMAAGPTWMPGFPMRMGPNVMLMWTPVPGATGYNVYRSASKDVPGQKITSGPTNNYMDVNVPMDKDAVYTVKATMPDGSESDAGTPGVLLGVKPLLAPKFGGELYASGQLTVRWELVVGAAFYNVYKSDAAAGPFALAASVQDLKFVDTKVEEGKSYFYQVSAVDKTNIESPKSDVHEIKIAKVVRAAVAKQYNLLEKQVKFVTYFEGTEDNPIRSPADISVDERAGLIYAVGTMDLFAIDLAGNIVRTFPKPADYQGEWGRPMGVAVDKSGDLWTTWFPSSVRRLTPEGRVVKEWVLETPKQDYLDAKRTSDWEEDGRLVPLPFGIAVDGTGRVWVADNAFFQVSVFEPDGKLVKRFDAPRPRSMEPGNLRALSFAKYDPRTQRVYFVDQAVTTIRAYGMDLLPPKDDKGEPTTGWQRGGSTPGYFQMPNGFGFLPDGDLCVIDGTTFRVQVFSPELDYKYTFVTKMGEPFPKELSAPVSVAFYKNRMYVTERVSNRISVFEVAP